MFWSCSLVAKWLLVVILILLESDNAGMDVRAITSGDGGARRPVTGLPCVSGGIMRISGDENTTRTGSESKPQWQVGKEGELLITNAR